MYNAYEDFEQSYDENYKFNEVLNNLIDFEVKKRVNEQDIDKTIPKLHQQITNHINKVSDLGKELSEKNVEIGKLNNSIRLLSDEMKNNDNKSFNEVISKITNGFKTGDKVYFIEDASYWREDCKRCNKTGKIKATIDDKEEEIRCPNCNGNGEVEKRGRRYYVRSFRLLLAIGADFKPVYKDDDSSYKTTINKTIYKTAEDAQKRADELNKKE